MASIRCYIGLGSNLRQPVQQIKTAIEELARLPNTQFRHSSSLYKSSPMGPKNQPDYINAVAVIETELTAMQLLQRLLDIEQQHGRERGEERWTARTLDLDLLLFGQEIINTQRLTVPHPGMAARNFVLYPLAELTPDLEIPQLGLLSELISGCERGDLVKLQDNPGK